MQPRSAGVHLGVPGQFEVSYDISSTPSDMERSSGETRTRTPADHSRVAEMPSNAREGPRK